MDDPRIGTSLGNYRIESLIGRGGMGVVYLAQHLLMATRKAALKVLAPRFADDPEFRDRFIRESDLAGALEHPNIIPVFDADEVDGVLFCAMRYVNGIDLKQELQRSKPLEPGLALDVLGDVAAALDFAHEHGLVHRDVKPGNVMIESGRTRRVFLADFGLVKRMRSDSTGTRQGLFLGTLDYAAPEQFQSAPIDGRTDEYALAAVLVECLTGEPPFVGDTEGQIVGAHLTQAPPSVNTRRPELPAALDPVIARGMAKDREARFPTCTELVDAARRAMAEPATVKRQFVAATQAAPPPPLAVRDRPAPQPSAAVPSSEGGTLPAASRRAGRPARARRDLLGALIVALIVASSVGFLVAAGQAGKSRSKASPSASRSAQAVATSPFLANDPSRGDRPQTGDVTLGSEHFSKSIFYPEPSDTITTHYDLDGRWSTFSASVGIQPDRSDALGTCRRDKSFGRTTYAVFVDGVRKEMDVIPCDQAKPISVPVSGASDLKLVMTLGNACDFFCSGDFAWGNARLAAK
jgi:serine/threonine-protein kinase